MNEQNADLNKPNASEGIYYKSIRLLHNIIVNIRKNIALFILCLLLGIVPLLIKNYSDSTAYKASFTVAYDELVRKIYGDRLAKINALVKRERTETLVRLLNIDKKAVESLKSVAGQNILGEDLKNDLNTDRVPFIVEIVVEDSSYIVPLQNAIVKFLETGNEFMAARKRIKLLENAEELEFINKQLGMIDTAYRKGNVSEGAVVSKPITTTGKAETKTSGSLIEFSYELYKRKQELLRRQRMPETLTILDDAIVSVQNKRPWYLMLALGFLLGTFLYALLAGLIIPALKFRER